MKETFLKVARQGHFFDKHQRVLVAVSGGKDSLALLHTLYELRVDLGISLGIAHVNHGQRIASEIEEDYLQKLARQMQLPIYTSRFTGKFTEAAGRTFRYAFFAEVMAEKDYTALVTAHHADDQAETVFMRILRGSRLLDIQGMQAVQPFGNGELIRPLLSFSKAELPDIFHFEDESNKEQTYLRNRIRYQYLPILEQENPRLKESLQIIGREVATVRTVLEDLTALIPMEDTTAFHAQTPAVQEIILQQYLEKFPTLQLKRAQFEQVLQLLRNRNSYQLPLKQGYFLIKDAQTYQICAFSPKTDDTFASCVVEYGNQVECQGMLFSFGTALENPDQILVFPSQEPVILRTRQPGDTLFLHGHHKKVRRYFIDHKVPKADRSKAIIIEQAGELYGIAGMVASDLSKFQKNDIIKPMLYIKNKGENR